MSGYCEVFRGGDIDMSSVADRVLLMLECVLISSSSDFEMLGSSGASSGDFCLVEVVVL